MNSVMPTSPLKEIWKPALASGIAAVAFGIAVLVWPAASVTVAAILFGAYLAVSGVMQVVFAVTLPLSSTGGRGLTFVSGAASLVLAVLCFRSLADSVLLLGIWVAVGFVFRGTSLVVTGIGDTELPGRGWVITSGVISLIAGFVALAYPFESLAVLTMVVGVWLVVLGVGETISAIRLRKAERDFSAAWSPR